MHRAAPPPIRQVLATALILAASAAAGFGWSPDTQRAIAGEAARLAPPDLAEQLFRHAHELAEGAVEPFSDSSPADHYKNPDGSGRLDLALEHEVAATISALRAFRSFAEVSERLGRVSHWVADLNNPLNTSAADPEEGRYFKDFLLYANSARPRFAVVLYENVPVTSSRGGVARLVSDALARGRELYPLIGREYRRIDFANGRLTFDDRSTAFGVAALAYSHAVTDAARLFRYIWLQAGGADPRSVLDRPRDRVLLLSPTAP